jgi:hypothetical protein
MESNDLENDKSFRRHLFAKNIINFALVGILLGAVLFCTVRGYINKDATGSLLGAIAGYSLAGMRKLHE